jgi:hypothetical protein
MGTMSNSVEWNWGNSTLQDVENIREAMKEYLEKDETDPYYIFPFNVKKIFDRIIEVGLRRQIQQKSAQDEILSPTEKQKLEKERDNYKDKFSSICKWFEYYQDKSKDLENKFPFRASPEIDTPIEIYDVNFYR